MVPALNDEVLAVVVLVGSAALAEVVAPKEKGAPVDTFLLDSTGLKGVLPPKEN